MFSTENEGEDKDKAGRKRPSIFERKKNEFGTPGKPPLSQSSNLLLDAISKRADPAAPGEEGKGAKTAGAGKAGKKKEVGPPPKPGAPRSRG